MLEMAQYGNMPEAGKEQVINQPNCFATVQLRKIIDPKTFQLTQTTSNHVLFELAGNKFIHAILFMSLKILRWVQ